MLWMQPWEDDSGLFIKLTDLSKNVGYFGLGPFGSGVYKYTAVPFIPIYYFFGHTIVAYFSLMLFLYILSVLVVYKVFSYILGENGGRVAGFILASGYIASDAFWRMTNGAATSLSFILISLFVLFYWNFYQSKKSKYYFWALVFYFLSLEYFVVRDHYLFIVAVAFEFVFLAFQKPFKSIFKSLLRLVPSALIFYYLVISVGDSRSSGLGQLVGDFLSGSYHLTFGFLASFANVIIPDYITKFLFKYNFGYFVLISSLFVATIAIIFRKKSHLLTTLYVIILSAWLIVSKFVYSTNLLTVSRNDIYLATVGGVLLILATAVSLVFVKNKKLFIFFLFWILTNIAAYSVYFPTVAYESISRYMSHSFYALAILIGVIFSEFDKNIKIRKLLLIFVALYGVLNIFNVFKYEYNFLITKSLPAKKFYQDLQQKLPKIEKGDILYFDVSSDSETAFRAAISGAMIPNSGTISWRYGIDRYDFSLVTDFNELAKIVREFEIGPEKIHSFWYGNKVLTDTSDIVGRYFGNSKQAVRQVKTFKITSHVITEKNTYLSWSQPDLDLDLPNPIDSSTPSKIELTITAAPMSPSRITRPLSQEGIPFKDEVLQNNVSAQILALEYKNYIGNFLKVAKFSVNSQWQDRLSRNVYDDDIDTVWQSDRVEWQKKKDWLMVDLVKPTRINRVFWINSDYSPSNPTSYLIESSLDGKNWLTVKDVSNLRPSPGRAIQEVTFDPIFARFVRMTITATLGGDSPMIAEFRIMPEELSSLNVTSADSFLKQPFSYVPDKNYYLKMMLSFGYSFNARLSWYGNKENVWQTSNDSEFAIKYDNVPHRYSFTLPAGGTLVKKIKISNFVLPGTIILTDVKYN